MNSNTLGQRIRRARMWRGVGQAELARAIGISPTSLSLIEKGRVQDPKSSTLEAIVRKLRISADFFLGITDEMEDISELEPAAVALAGTYAHGGSIVVLVAQHRWAL